MSFCYYLEQLCPSVTITLADQKICILDKDKNEITIDSITSTLDSPKKEKFNKTYDLLILNHAKNYEVLTKMLSDKETKKTFGEFEESGEFGKCREYSDNLFIKIIQRLLDFLRDICLRSTSRKENNPSLQKRKSSYLFKSVNECTKYLGIKNNINDSEQAQGMRPTP